MSKEQRFVVIKRAGSSVSFLRHEGHAQYCGANRTDAMEYTRRDVAQALADKHGGEVQETVETW